MSEKISLTGYLSKKYVITTPRWLLCDFDVDEPAYISWFANTLEEARKKAAPLKNAEIHLNEYVKVDGFSGLLHRTTKQDLTAK